MQRLPIDIFPQLGRLPPAEGGDAVPAILVVDDNDDVREILVAVLQSCGYSVLSAGSAREALALLSSATAVDLLLTDVSMPEMDGVSLARQACALRPGLVVRFISGLVDSLPSLEAIQPKLIQKPFRVDRLRDEIARALASGA